MGTEGNADTVLTARIDPHGEVELFIDEDLLLQGICFLREAPERAIGTDRRAGK